MTTALLLAACLAASPADAAWQRAVDACGGGDADGLRRPRVVMISHLHRSGSAGRLRASRVAHVGHADARIALVVWHEQARVPSRASRVQVRGAYNHLTNTATAVDAEALAHEMCHAILFQREGLAAMRDEARVRTALREGG